ncbi:YbaN family protein [Bdellovibrio sp. KM01]|uniref:YbaN family protein n=1 Tax=Bdellovibrio sp. KM01 TaxID=2748865 RepID=UPI001C674998|nr:YbaN family protein [Bdellovibrio sp. KM01]
MPGIVKNPVLRSALVVLGSVSLILGIIGAFLPVLPTTPFVLLSAWCFLRSSEKAHAWLYRQPLFGKALTDWDRNKAISRKNKVIAITMILFSLCFMWWSVPNTYLVASLTVVLLAVSIFIATRNEV